MLHGEIEPPDVAIFSDTGNEPQAVYDWLEYLKNKWKARSSLLLLEMSTTKVIL